MQTNQSPKQPAPKPGDVEVLMARGNIVLARRLEQRTEAAKFAKQLLQKPVSQRVLPA